jgi:hypothetical protein
MIEEIKETDDEPFNFKKDWSSLKEYYKNINKNKSFRYFGTYKVSKRLFQASFLLIVLFLGIIIYFSVFGNTLYYKCPNDSVGGCDNPFIDKPNSLGNSLPKKVKDACVYDWCKNETLPPGFVGGKEEPWYFKAYTQFVIMILLIAICLNHVLFNLRGKK